MPCFHVLGNAYLGMIREVSPTQVGRLALSPVPCAHITSVTAYNASKLGASH